MNQHTSTASHCNQTNYIKKVLFSSRNLNWVTKLRELWNSMQSSSTSTRKRHSCTYMCVHIMPKRVSSRISDAPHNGCRKLMFIICQGRILIHQYEDFGNAYAFIWIHIAMHFKLPLIERDSAESAHSAILIGPHLPTHEWAAQSKKCNKLNFKFPHPMRSGARDEKLFQFCAASLCNRAAEIHSTDEVIRVCSWILAAFFPLVHTQRTTMERSLKLKQTETVLRRDVKCALAGWCGAIVSAEIAPHHLQTALFSLSSISFVERIRNTQNPNPSPKNNRWTPTKFAFIFPRSQVSDCSCMRLTHFPPITLRKKKAS